MFPSLPTRAICSVLGGLGVEFLLLFVGGGFGFDFILVNFILLSLLVLKI